MAHDELSCHQACLSSPPGDSQSLRASKLLLPHIQNFQQQKKQIFCCKIFIIECLNKVQRSAMLWLCGGNKNKIIHLKLWVQLIICRQAFSGIFACFVQFHQLNCLSAAKVEFSGNSSKHFWLRGLL